MRRLLALPLLVACAPAPAPAYGTTPIDPNQPAPPAEPAMVPESEGDATPSAEPKGPAPELTPVVPSGPSLPEVSVRTIGLHVGGGPNDPAGRAPFIEALEGRFPELLRCYREIGADASSGGTFGADIHIDPKGAPVRVDRVRTAIGGDELKACVVAVLETAAFQAVKRPTVVSYSIRFDVSD